MSKKARKAKKLRRIITREWVKCFSQRDLEMSFETILYYGTAGIAKDKDGNVRAMTAEEIEDTLLSMPLKKKKK